MGQNKQSIEQTIENLNELLELKNEELEKKNSELWNAKRELELNHSWTRHSCKEDESDLPVPRLELHVFENERGLTNRSVLLIIPGYGLAHKNIQCVPLYLSMNSNQFNLKKEDITQRYFAGSSVAGKAVVWRDTLKIPLILLFEGEVIDLEL